MNTIKAIIVLLSSLSLNSFHLNFRTLIKPIVFEKLRTQNFVPKLSTTTSVEPESDVQDRVILITDKAMAHLKFLKTKQDEAKELFLRMGVRAGGCSGMSYVMDMIDDTKVSEDDHIEDLGGIKCAVDPKSLLYLYGLQLDYSDELIGGGFKFSNPNAETSCGCGKSFGV